MAKAGPAARTDIYSVMLVITAIVYVLGIVCGSIFLDKHYLQRFTVRRPPAAVTPGTVEREIERPIEEAPKEAPGAGAGEKPAAPGAGEGDLDIDSL